MVLFLLVVFSRVLKAVRDNLIGLMETATEVEMEMEVVVVLMETATEVETPVAEVPILAELLLV